MARPILVSSLRFLVVWIIRGYQVLVSPFLGRNCRFMPTCSQYGIEAVERFGVCRGLWLTACRLLKCGPWHPGGYDPVPPS